MYNLNLDIIIIIIIIITFLLSNIIVGIFSGGVKTVKEYAVGKRDFSTGDIVATIVAIAYFTKVLTWW